MKQQKGHDLLQDIIGEILELARRRKELRERTEKVVDRLGDLFVRDAAFRNQILNYFLVNGLIGEPVFEDVEKIVGGGPRGVRAPAAVGKARETRPFAAKGDGGKMPLKGPKTPFMQGQLKFFKKYLAKMGYSGDPSKLYGWAEKCWADKQTKWDLAKSATGTKRGYSCTKALADAYRNLTVAQRAAL